MDHWTEVSKIMPKSDQILLSFKVGRNLVAAQGNVALDVLIPAHVLEELALICLA